jgi:GTP-binding protein
MQIKQAEFVLSNTDYKLCPPPLKPEFAFIGRSNVGKSSLINMLCNRNKLAKTSVRPGKTQLINHFIINDEWYLVDLPGYGYAKVSKKDRAKWERMIDAYLVNRINLMSTFILIDLRIPPQTIDLEMMEKFGEKGLPFAIAFTKADKLKPAEVEENFALYKEKLLETWYELPPLFITSSVDAKGKDELLDFIGETINIFDVDAIKRKLP